MDFYLPQAHSAVESPREAVTPLQIGHELREALVICDDLPHLSMDKGKDKYILVIMGCDGREH